MKKVLLAVFCFSISVLCFGQNAKVQEDIKDVTFFGVDFSLAKSYGTAETISQFTEAFQRINGLFITEAQKYDVAKYFKKNVTETAVRQLEDVNQNIDKDTFFANSGTYEISEKELAEEIKSLPLNEAKGTGLIFVAELLNKPNNQGTYHIVFFDIASREILDTWKASGKAKGFGLRNYWAGSIYDIMQNLKMKKSY